MNPELMNQQHDLGRQHWLAERRRGLGGTDAAAILGVHPWKTAFEVWVEKTGRMKDQDQTKAMKWGNLLEDPICEEYMRQTGRKLWKPDKLMAHPDHPCIIGTPDRLVIGERRGVDVKTSGAYQMKHWGAEETDEIPRHYIVQAAHYMAITGFPEWDIFVLIGGNDDRLYTVKRDLAFEKILISRLVEWWNRHIVQDDEPSVDGSPTGAAYIGKMYPEHAAPRIAATTECQEIGEALCTVISQIKEFEKTKESYRNQLKLAIGPAKGMDGNGWRATWCGGNEKSVVDHEVLARNLMRMLEELGKAEQVNAAVLQAAAMKRTTVSFRFTPDGD